MKNILIIAPSLYQGGAERTASLLANKLMRSNEFNVVLCLLSNRKIFYPVDEKIQIYHLEDMIKNITMIDRNIKRVKCISHIVKKNNIDLVIGYTSLGGIISCMVNKLTGVKNIVCERQDPKQFTLPMRIIRDKLYRVATAGVFQTHEAAEYFSEIVKTRVIIQNFLDVEAMPKPLAFTERKNRIVSVGRLEPVKNHAMLVKAFAEISHLYPDYTLEIYGEGSEFENLKKLIESLKLLHRVFLRGYSSNVFDEIKSAKLFVLTSHYEGFPNALLEAMAMGLAVISTDCPCGGPRTMIEYGYNGFLIPVNDLDALKREIIKCLDDESLMERVSRNALSVREVNSAERIMARWISLINNIISDQEVVI